MKQMLRFIICILVTFIYTFINILLVLKSGMSISASLITPFIYFIVFRLFFNPSIDDIFNVQMITTSSSIATFGIAISYVSVILLELSPPNLITLMLITGISNIISIGVGMFFSKGMIDNERLPFPKSKVTSNLLLTISDFKQVKKGKYITFFALIGGLASCLPKGFIKIGSVVTLPSYIKPTLSPMLFGVGVMLKIKSAILLLAGTSYSLLCYATSYPTYENNSFRTHINNPSIISVAIGFLLSSVIVTMPRIVNQLKLFKELFTKKNGFIATTNKAGTGFHVLVSFILLSFAIILITVFHISLHSLLFFLALCFPLSMITMRMRGETGLGSSAVVYIAMPLIGLATRDMTQTLILSGLIVLIGTQAGHYLENLKVAQEIGLSRNKMMYFYSVGALVGSTFGILALAYCGRLFSFGSEALPSPTSIAWATQVKGIIHFTDVENINVIYILSSLFIGLLLESIHISTSTMAMGILLPPSSSILLFLGGLTNYFVSKSYYKDTENIASGLIVGDGIATFIRSIRILIS